MKKYLGGIACAAVASAMLAFLSSAFGYDLIGYSFQSRLVAGLLVGGLTGVLAGLPRLLAPQQWSSYLAMVVSAVVAELALWFGECVLLPGTNGGLQIHYALLMVLIGAWVGSAMWLGASVRMREIRVNSPLGWIIHILFAALMGWFVGYLLIPGLVFNLAHYVLATVVRLVLAAGVGALFLYAFRTGMDTGFPFKNGGWLR